VKAVSFYTNDESGWDWTGSDEPYWIFNGVGQNGSDRSTMSHVFGDIDTGDTGYFNADEGCMYLSCSGGTAPLGMGFNVEAWEHDLGQPQQTLANIAYAFHAVGGFYVDGGDALWLGTLANKIGDAIDYLASIGNDDLIASQSWTYSSASLAAGAPTVGASFSDVRTFSDGDATYSLTLRVTRVG
jgi:hypothetical protein